MAQAPMQDIITLVRQAVQAIKFEKTGHTARVKKSKKHFEAE